MKSTQIPRVHVFVAASLDGYIATREGGISWLDRVRQEGEDYGYSELMKRVDAVVMGRNTYDTLQGLGAWPFGTKKVVVFTRRPLVPKNNELIATGVMRPVFEKLSDECVRNIYLDGGQAIQQGIREGLISEITLSIIPVLLGGGIPLFAQDGLMVSLQANRVQHYSSGLIQVQYSIE